MSAKIIRCKHRVLYEGREVRAGKLIAIGKIGFKCIRCGKVFARRLNPKTKTYYRGWG